MHQMHFGGFFFCTNTAFLYTYLYMKKTNKKTFPMAMIFKASPVFESILLNHYDIL